MSYLVIIRGPLGVGKTTVSKTLAKKLGALYVSIDEVLNENSLDQIDEKEGGISVKSFLKGNEIVLPEIRQALQSDRTVVIDGCFYHKEQIQHFLDHLEAESHVFTLKAPVETCIGRDAERKKTYGEDAARAVHMFVSKFDYGTVIDTEGKTLKDTISEIFQQLPGTSFFRGKS